MIPPDTVVYEVRFAVVLMAIAMFIIGGGMRAIATLGQLSALPTMII